MFNLASSIVRKYSTNLRNFNEIKIPVPWGHISWKWWEPCNSRPIVVVHGWQDNCGSFDRLIPLLTKDVGFLAIDLPGHGFSSRLPTGLYYENMNYPIILRYIMNYFNWPKVSLMGHSLGAITCYNFSMLFGKDTEFLILIDGLKPLHTDNFKKHFSNAIDQFLKYNEHSKGTSEPPSYSLEELKKMIAATQDNSIDIKYAETMLKRNMKQSSKDPKKFYITRDPRLKATFFPNWASKELIQYARQIKCPIFLMKASKSGYFEDEKNYYEVFNILKDSNPNLVYKIVEGTHHLHLNTPELVSDLINDFIMKYDRTNRDEGGITAEIRA